MFIVLLSFSISLTRDETKYRSLNDQLCMIRRTLVNLNCVELKYYPLMISLDKGSGSCNVIILDSTNHFQTSCMSYHQQYRKRNKRHK